ncbi:GAF domain-containing protein [Aminomonas paucivorans]|uniref:GAF domain-containing protein n=1 Tax=Aminomonas paucivorans TaxID=81412 RepID=UPI00332CE2FD
MAPFWKGKGGRRIVGRGEFLWEGTVLAAAALGFVAAGYYGSPVLVAVTGMTAFLLLHGRGLFPTPVLYLLLGSAAAFTAALSRMKPWELVMVLFIMGVPSLFLHRFRSLSDRLLKLLDAFSQQVSECASPEDAARSALRSLQGLGWYSDASVFLWEKEKDELHQVAGSEHFDVGLRLSRGKGVVWRAFASGKPILVKDVTCDPDFVPSQMPTRSEVAVPLLVGGRRLGVLNVESGSPRRLSLRDLWFLSILGSMLSHALLNLEQRLNLEQSLKRQKTAAAEQKECSTTLQQALQEQGRTGDELERKARIANTLLSLLEDPTNLQDIPRLCCRVVDLIHEKLSYPNVYLLVRNLQQSRDEDPAFRLAASCGLPQDEYVHTLSFENPEGIWGQVVSSRKPYLCRNTREDPHYRKGNASVLSELTMPILSSDELWGILDLQAEEPDAFDEDDLRLLEGIAYHLGGILEHAYQVKAMARRARQMRMLHDVVQETSRCTDVEEMGACAVRLIADRLGYQAVTLFRTVNPQGGVRVVATSQPYEQPEAAEELLLRGASLTSRCARTGVLQNTPDVAEVREWIPLVPTVRSQLDIPVEFQGKGYGVLCLEDSRPRAFHGEDEELFSILARHLGTTWRLIDSFERIREEATHDALTGLANIRHFRIRFAEELARAERRQVPLAFLMMDLGGFKVVNDLMGHLFGDEMLKKVARLLERNLREYDVLARYGGDEFVLVLPETDEAGARSAADRIRSGVRSLVIEGIGPLPIDVGISLYPQDGQDGDVLIRRADERMYQEKNDRKRQNEQGGMERGDEPRNP